MRCEHCRKKTVTVPCKYCPLSVCCGCIGLETHGCLGLSKKVNDQKSNLEKKLSYTSDTKHGLLHR